LHGLSFAHRSHGANPDQVRWSDVRGIHAQGAAMPWGGRRVADCGELGVFDLVECADRKIHQQTPSASSAWQLVGYLTYDTANMPIFTLPLIDYLDFWIVNLVKV